MNNEAVLETFKHKENILPISVLSDGREVIAEHIDEDNHLFYIVKGEENEIIDAQKVRVIKNLKKPESDIHLHTET